jgi:hypothetical protein
MKLREQKLQFVHYTPELTGERVNKKWSAPETLLGLSSSTPAKHWKAV